MKKERIECLFSQYNKIERNKKKKTKWHRERYYRERWKNLGRDVNNNERDI